MEIEATFDPTRPRAKALLADPEALHAVVAAVADGSIRPLWRLDGDRLHIRADTVDETRLRVRLDQPNIILRHVEPVVLTVGETVMFHVTANPTTGHNGVHTPIRGEGQQLAWLERTFANHGFRLDMGEIMGERLLRFRKKHTTISLLQVAFTGRATILDATHAQAMLEAGIGRGKAYGGGLVVLA